MSEAVKTTTMTREEFMRAEHDLQMGISNTLPDGTPLKDAQETLANQTKQQEKAFQERGEEVRKKFESSDNLKETVEVVVAENGAISARPVGEKTENQNPPPTPPESDLPEDFPGRKELIAGGVLLLEKVSTLDRDALIAINGIGGKTADLILAYGKTE